MIRLLVVDEVCLDPIHNLAMEANLLQVVKANEIILYLWQNEKTVVIGRNQNAVKECNVEELLKDHGTLVRRQSGGGAVYHDLGNLNFTFVMHKNLEDIAKQTQVIVEALKQCGIEASVKGRNDLIVHDRKCSGHAYYTQKERCYHHGTLLLNVDQGLMERFLRPHVAKLKARGVDSVRSRTINLMDVNSELSLVQLKQALIQATAKFYKTKPIRWEPVFDLTENMYKMSDKQWIYGESHSFEIVKQKYCSFGMLQIELQVVNNTIQQVHVYSDCMDLDLIAKLKQVLIGVKYQKESLKKALKDELAEVYTLWDGEEL